MNDDAQCLDALGELFAAIEETKIDVEDALRHGLETPKGATLTAFRRVHFALKSASASLGPDWKM